MGLIDKAPPPVVGKSPGLLGEGTPAFLTSKVDFLVNWARRNSLWPMPLGTACCGIEMMASYASDFDLARFGMERMSFSPRQADVLICAGRVTYKFAPVLRRIWDQMPQPKWCVSMGACASTGGVFDVYSMVQGIDTIVPVEGRWLDPMAFYRQQPPFDSHDVIALPDGEKSVPIPILLDDGSTSPANTKLVWPYACERE